MFTQVCALHSSSVFVQGAANIDKEGAVLCGSRYVVGLWFCCGAFCHENGLKYREERIPEISN